MSTSDAEAYVINSDGTKTAIPVNFIDGSTTSGNPAGKGTASSCTAAFVQGFARGNAEASSTRQGGAPKNAPNVNAYGYAPQDPFTNVGAETTAPRRSLHLGRRILGLCIAAIGVPLLILPGPGLALIGLGLLMVVMP